MKTFIYILCTASVGCGNNPCLNKGTCISLSENNYICVCSASYFGKNCEFTNFGCDSKVCQNGGSCVLNANNVPMCLCESSFTGTNCETCEYKFWLNNISFKLISLNIILINSHWNM